MVLCPVCRRTPENPQINLRLIPIPITPIRACLQDLADPIASKLAPTRSASIKATIVGAGLPAMPATGFVCRIELIPSPASWLLQDPPPIKATIVGAGLPAMPATGFVCRIELIPSPASWLLQGPPLHQGHHCGSWLASDAGNRFVYRIELIPSPASWLLQGMPPSKPPLWELACQRCRQPGLSARLS